MSHIVLAIVLVIIALAFDFFNGKNDSANTVATMIASQALSPRQALVLSAICEFIGPFLFGRSVAVTIGRDVVPPETITIAVTLSALLAAIIWNGITIALGIPSSSSHALVGGLIGATAAGYGFYLIRLEGILRVLLSLFLSPLLGLLFGFVVMKLILFLARGAPPSINVWLRRGQWVAAAGLALSHGGNDAQKTMGVITMGLVALGLLPTFEVPLWVVAAAAAAIAIGTYSGGWNVIRTLGRKFFKVRPVHAFSSQVSSAAVIFGAALLGGPVSTTHVVSASILGAGSGQRVSQVRWGVAREILMAWGFTIPLAGILAAALYLPIAYIVG